VQVKALIYLGANAFIIGRNASKTESMASEMARLRPGAKVIGMGGLDVRKIEDMERAVERCVKELGAIDFVMQVVPPHFQKSHVLTRLYSAGAAGNFISPLSNLSSNAFKTVLDIDTLGSFNTFKATIPHLVASAKRNPNTGSNASSGGRIIFISASFHFAGMPLQGHAAVAKAGVDALSATVALEYGPRGVTSNIITPGPIANTEGMARLGSQDGDQSSLTKKVPLQRWGTAKEIADGTIYLFSDAGNYVNGEVLVIDGGDWRSPGAPGGAMSYPDFLLNDTFARGKSQKKSSKL
jgi:peroxisomal 2,4-dienoyl-CoA reductase